MAPLKYSTYLMLKRLNTTKNYFFVTTRVCVIASHNRIELHTHSEPQGNYISVLKQVAHRLFHVRFFST